ncbi:MAG: hypothetical protein M1821_000649 [Bathelium mastoideum]|nr:MAG: hypothetical protein M1821_000649 [Bathelium mastoideum]
MSGSLKDTVKALNATFSAASVPLPLPDELQATIEAFLDKHADIDDSDSQRLQDELLAVFSKYVAAKPEKYAPFIRSLQHFRPAITSEARLFEWWELIIRPCINAMGQKKNVIEEAKELLLSILVYDADDKDVEEKARLSNKFLVTVLEIYLDRARTPSVGGTTISPEDEYIARDLESILIRFGRKKPKDLLLALDRLVFAKSSRLRALSLLCTFVRHQPPHLYLVQETTLIEHLLKCLMIDTSTTAISLALTTLIMFLPHIPTSLIAHLPRLFLIYSRLLCWDKMVVNSEVQREEDFDHDDEDDNADAQRNTSVISSWEKLDQALNDAESTAPELLHYFTFLYGLYPLNFMSYIRKPRKYLKSIEFPGADDFDLEQNLTRARTEQFQKVHLMHPGFYTTTAEDELTDNRWIKADPSDVVMECMSLCVAVPTGLSDPGPPPDSKLPAIPSGIVRTEDIPPHSLVPRGGESPAPSNGLSSDLEPRTNGSWRDTQSSYAMVEPPSASRKDSEAFHSLPSHSSKAGSPASHSRDFFDSPTLGPQTTASTSSKPSSAQAQLVFPAVPRKLTTRAEAPSPALDAFAQSVGNKLVSPPTSPLGDPAGMAHLQREVMLLRNDLNFERYLKQQHLAHIGQLQRKNIKDATAEAETQTLLNSNRTLKAKLTKANESYTALQKENVTSRNQSKKWEGELSSKLRSLRDEQKSWQTAEESLGHELQRARQDRDTLRQLLADAEARDLLAQQKLRAAEHDLAQLAALQQQAAELRAELRRAEARELAHERAQADAEILRTELDTAQLRLQSREAERARARQAYERKIAELESRVLAAEHPLPGREGGGGGSGGGGANEQSVQVLEAALQESQRKLDQLRKAHARLLHRYTELEMRVQELDGGEVLLQEGSSDVHDFAVSSVADRRRSQGGSVGHGGGSVSGSIGGLSSVSRPGHLHGLTDAAIAPDDDDYVINLDQYNGLPGRSMTLGSVNSQGRPSTIRSSGTGPPPQGSVGGRNPSVGMSEQAGSRSVTSPTWEGEVVQSSGKSAWSEGSEGSKSEKNKIQPKSEVRVYGRGGAQNIGKKEKEKIEKSKPPKTGGFRGIRGIM